MNTELLEDVLLPILFLAACAFVLVRLLQPVMNALGERLRPRVPAQDDAVRNELQTLMARVAELEQRARPPELTSGTAASELEEG